jgi:L-iditol 2-dehydrogenase
MKAVRLYGVGDVRVADEPMPTPGPGQELVQVTAVGLCGSDLHWFEDGGIGDAVITDPIVPGHEFAGVIASGPRQGVRVAIDPAIPCHHCELCHDGHPNLCVNIGFAGHSTDGPLQEYLTWPSSRMHPIPDEISDADAAMLEPLGVAIHAVDLAHPRVGESVVVVGAGPIGLCTIQVVRAAGATKIVAVEPLAHRRNAAARWADVVLDPAADDFAACLREAVGPLGAHRVIECAGNDAGIDISVDAARPGATVVLAGIPGDLRSSFLAAVARRKGLTFRMVRRMKEVYPRAIALVTSGRVDVRSQVTHVFSLDQAAKAFETGCARQGGKVVIAPTLPDGTATVQNVSVQNTAVRDRAARDEEAAA